MASRRESLKIIGAIGTTCAFPFSADELYGQHVHTAAAAQTAVEGPYTPKSFSAAEFVVYDGHEADIHWTQVFYFRFGKPRQGVHVDTRE